MSQRLIDLAILGVGVGWLWFWGSRPDRLQRRKRPCNLCHQRPHAPGCVTQQAQGFRLR